jgi:hypothetical protein
VPAAALPVKVRRLVHDPEKIMRKQRAKARFILQIIAL